jgi:hypothetical protein
MISTDVIFTLAANRAPAIWQRAVAKFAQQVFRGSPFLKQRCLYGQ